MTYLINTECPKEMNEQSCPLRQWIKTQGLFHTTQNESLLLPIAPLYRLARAEYVHAIEHMNQICHECQASCKKNKKSR